MKSTWKATKQTKRSGERERKKCIVKISVHCSCSYGNQRLYYFCLDLARHIQNIPKRIILFARWEWEHSATARAKVNNKTHIAHINCTQACHLYYSNSLCHLCAVSFECSWRFGCLDVVVVFQDCCPFFFWNSRVGFLVACIFHPLRWWSNRMRLPFARYVCMYVCVKLDVRCA